MRAKPPGDGPPPAGGVGQQARREGPASSLDRQVILRPMYTNGVGAGRQSAGLTYYQPMLKRGTLGRIFTIKAPPRCWRSSRKTYTNEVWCRATCDKGGARTECRGSMIHGRG
jgi:hypothetical protein